MGGLTLKRGIVRERVLVVFRPFRVIHRGRTSARSEFFFFFSREREASERRCERKRKKNSVYKGE